MRSLTRALARAGVLGFLACGVSPLHAVDAVVTLSVQPGWDIFDPNLDFDPNYAYRYGPSIILNDDGSVDVWTASPGGLGSDGGGQWDWIRYRRSTDGGETWTPDVVALQATPQSKDRMSVCDPGVICFDGYYYIGYTAISEALNEWNHVFVARSHQPQGPYEKWNGSGWGGNPQPIITFSGPPDVFGAGEPSFVVHENTLYCYYTWISKDSGGNGVYQTRLSTAPAHDTNWPGKLIYQGIAINRVNSDEDSADVKFSDATRRFVSVSVCNRMRDKSYIAVRESLDGLSFSTPVRLRENILPWSHNVGISGTAEGHLSIRRQNFLSYAYSKNGGISWGIWYTYWQPLTVTVPATATAYAPWE